MGMDVYAGTFTRYYARNWKTATQKFCEENGIAYQQFGVHADIAPEDRASVEEIEESVNAWIDHVVGGLKGLGIEKAQVWRDDNDKPYYTDKPDWGAFGALLIYAAAKLLNKEAPEQFDKGMNSFDHPLLKEAAEGAASETSLYRGVCHWLPIDDSFMFKYVLPNGAEAEMGTVRGLKAELCRINEMCWNADEETVIGWNISEGYPDDGWIVDGKPQIGEVHKVYNTQSLAKFAFSLLWQAVRFSEKENVPIILDY